MSDYPNPNLHRGDGVSARGLLIGLGVIVAILVLLVLAGGGGGDGTADETVSQDAISPATTSVAVPSE
jgi:hypothetical protein